MKRLGTIGTRSIGVGKQRSGNVSYQHISDLITPVGAWGLRKLVRSYAGNCLRLRRSSDNVESDFGFTAAMELDTAAIAAWLSGANGYCVTWYDQSGNGYDVTQANTDKQPLYVASGINGKPDLLFDGTNDVLAHTVADWRGSDSTGSCFAVARLTDPLKDDQTILGSSDAAGTNNYIQLRAYRSSTSTFAGVFQRSGVPAGDNIVGNTPITAGTAWLFTIKSTGSIYVVRVNGVEQVLSAAAGANTGDWFADTTLRDNFSIGAYIRTAEVGYLKGDLSEVILCATDITGDALTGVEANLTSRFFSVSEPEPEPAELNEVWSFYGHPHALRYVGTADQTYLSFVDSAGAAKVAAYNHSNSQMSAAVTLKAALQLDDHIQPGLLVRESDKRIMAWYSAHNGSTIYQRISTNPEDITAWGVEASLDAALGSNAYSYPTPIQLAGEANSPIYLFYRVFLGAGLGYPDCYSKSTDGGATWAAQTVLFANDEERPYFQFVQNGNARIDFCLNDGHPNEVTGNSVYHGYYQGGNLYKSNGTLVGTIDAGPYAPNQFTQVYDGSSVEGWVWDIAIDGSGNPVIVYAAFVNTITDHRYRYARWSGSAWDDHEICQAGGYLIAAEPNYSGGVSLDHDDPATVYCSREVGGNWSIWKYVTADGGATWTPTEQTTPGTTKQFRPVVPRNSAASLKVLYIAGRYDDYSNYDTKLYSLPHYTSR